MIPRRSFIIGLVSFVALSVVSAVWLIMQPKHRDLTMTTFTPESSAPSLTAADVMCTWDGTAVIAPGLFHLPKEGLYPFAIRTCGQDIRMIKGSTSR